MIANRPQLFALAVLLAASCATDEHAPGGNTGGGGKGDGTSEQLEVVARTPVAKLVAGVACVESFNAENESNGVRLYFSSSSYGDAREILDRGLTSTFLGDETCVSGGGTLPYAVVGPFDSATKINAAIMDAGGYEEVLVVFYSRDALDEAFRANTVRALEDI